MIMTKFTLKHLTLILLSATVFFACEPDDLSKPVKVHLEFSYKEGVVPIDYLSFNKIIWSVENIDFYGIRKEGNDVLFHTRPGDSFGNHILTPAQNVSYITFFDLKQGIYQLMRWNVGLGEIDDEIYSDEFVDSDDFGLIIEGTYTRLDGTIVLLFIAIEEEEILTFEALIQDEETSLAIISDNTYTMSLEVNPHALMRGIPRSMLEEVETEEEDAVEFIEISEDENEKLYDLVLFQLTKTLKIIVR